MDLTPRELDVLIGTVKGKLAEAHEALRYARERGRATARPESDLAELETLLTKLKAEREAKR